MMAHSPRRSQVFLVRTWTEEREEQLPELRGMVRNVHSGETRYFRTWPELLCFVASQAKALDQGTEVDQGGEGLQGLSEVGFNANPDLSPDGRD